jgi:hypothetical protein
MRCETDGDGDGDGDGDENAARNCGATTDAPVGGLRNKEIRKTMRTPELHSRIRID